MANPESNASPTPKLSLLDQIHLSPVATLLMTVLYLGGVVYGMYLKSMVGQPWLLSLSNLLTVGLVVAMATLVVTDRAPFSALLHAACLSGAAIFTIDGAWWQVSGQKNVVLVINVCVCFVALFAFIAIMVGNPWCGFGILAVGLAAFSVESALLNSRYPLLYLGLSLPALAAFGASLFMLRRSFEQLLRQPAGEPDSAPSLELGALDLSEAEQRCLEYLRANLSTKEMAAREGVSPSAIHNRFSALYRKFGVVDRQHLLLKLTALRLSSVSQ